MEDELVRYDAVGLGELIFSCFIGHIVAYWERELGEKIEENELESLNWNDYQASSNITGADYLGAVEEIQLLLIRVFYLCDVEI
jgi:hypothetical protein